ncbi:NAD-dependent epimerase/dehydratase family protein [Ponticoccus alexandrii]|nr:NAD-dependent epimerase/dehydratase family protein [Ponticoccus alexandrii]ETA49694.1 epimerase [Rhodobacteraceae bacterium PD-2]
MGEIGDRIIAVTGANGFVGRACVAEARRRGHPVLALCRSAPLPEWEADAGVTVARIDLSTDGDRLPALLAPVEALIHAAAFMGDSPEVLARDTLAATGAVLAACRAADIRLVMISSLAVYDTDALSPGDAVTEASPLIALAPDALDQPEAYLRSVRDPYAGAKRLQEAMMAQHGGAEGSWILRSGAIWGPGRSWHALQGFWASKLFVTIGSDGELPLAHVDHVARVAVGCAQTAPQGESVLNVFDEDRPTRARFLTAHRRCYGWPRLNVTVPYGAWLALVRLLKPMANRLPGLFREPILRARMMPLRYPNTALRSAFPGEDADTFEGLMARTREAET